MKKILYLAFLVIFFFQSNPSYADLTQSQIIERMTDEILYHQKKINEIKSLLTRGHMGLGGRSLLTEEAKNNQIYLYEDLKQVTVQNKEDFFLITKIAPNEPADEAGLKSGDVLLTIDNKRILGKEDLVKYLSLNHSKIIQLEIWREKKIVTTKLKLGSKKIDENKAWGYELQIKNIEKKLKELEIELNKLKD